MRLAWVFFFLAFVGWNSPVFSQYIVGQVIHVADGDTFVMTSGKKKIKVRLYGIDAPENGQDFANASREFLQTLILNYNVRVTKKYTDRFRRIVGIVVFEDQNVNERLLEMGYAWHHKKYDQNPEWVDMETRARAAGKGLWSMPNPTAPWEFRKQDFEKLKSKNLGIQ
ncbi:MAG TPA: thermonuclease family protein [Chryseosolibacter sp.]|nr:thermonuclease family protein [Chryseosolibacter sp.]